MPLPLLLGPNLLRISDKVGFSVWIFFLFVLIIIVIILLPPLLPDFTPSKSNREDKSSSLLRSVRFLLSNWDIVISVVVLIIVRIVHCIAPCYVHLVHHYAKL